MTDDLPVVDLTVEEVLSLFLSALEREDERTAGQWVQLLRRNDMEDGS
jgi:hypothetical protein